MTPLSDKLVSPPAIADLLVEHRAKVDEILALLPIQGDEDVIIDALFALRFLLSSRSRDVAEATKNAKATLEWRRANRAKLAAAAQGDFPCAETFRSFVKSAYGGVLGGYHPTFIIRAGVADTPGLLKALTDEQQVEYQLMQNEQSFRAVDRLTRETGRLCKLITVIDGHGMSMMKFDRRLPKTHGAASHQSAVFYPQLLGRSVMLNPPTFFKWLFGLFSHMLPASQREKFGVCGGSKTWENSATECPFLKKFGARAVEAVPPFLGGTMPMPAELQY